MSASASALGYRCERAAVISAAGLALVGCDGSSPATPLPSPVAAAIALSASPSTILLSGSRVQVTARVTTATGGAFSGARVAFTTTAGALSPTEAVTRDGGEASVILDAAAPAQVTAAADGVGGRTLQLPAVAPFRLELAPAGVTTSAVHPTADPWRGVVTVTPAAGIVNPPSPERLMTTCGSGNDVSYPGVASGQIFFSCALGVGRHVVSATARMPNGWTVTSSLAVDVDVIVVERPIYYTVVESGRGRVVVSFSVETRSDGWRHVWDFGDGRRDTTALPFVDHVYESGNREREITVRVTNRDGRTIATGRLVGFW